MLLVLFGVSLATIGREWGAGNGGREWSVDLRQALLAPDIWLLLLAIAGDN